MSVSVLASVLQCTWWHNYLRYRKWAEVMFSPLSVCLFVCLSANRISQKLVDGFGCNLVFRVCCKEEMIRCWWRAGYYNLLRDSSPVRDRAKNDIQHSEISQNVVDGFRWNLVDRLGVWQGRNYSILVKIHIQIWLFLKWFFTIERSGHTRYTVWHDISKSCDGFRQNLVDE